MHSATRTVRQAVAVVLAVAALTSVACSSSRDASPTAGESVPFSAEDGRFRAEFPGTPARQQEQVTSAGIDLVVVAYSAETDDESVMVGYTDYPPSFQSEGVLDAAAQGSAANVGGTIQNSTDHVYMGYPAKDITVTTSEAMINERLFLVGNRLYTLIGVARASRPASYDRLLETFALL
jgi:hypothetical protein